MAFTPTFLVIAVLVAPFIGFGLGSAIGLWLGNDMGYDHGWRERGQLRTRVTPAEATGLLTAELRRDFVAFAKGIYARLDRFEQQKTLDRARLDSLGTKVTAVLSNCTLANAPVFGRTDRPSQGTGLPMDVGHGPCRGSETLETAPDDRQGVSERPAVHPSAECQACAAAREVCRRAIIRHSVSPVEAAVESIRCPRHSGYYRADGITPIGVSSRTDR